MTLDIGPWLAAIGLPQYAQAFRANHIDAALLPGLTAEDLKEIGVASLGHRKIIVDAIAAAREALETSRRVDRASAGPSAVLLAQGLLQAGDLDAAQAAASEAIALCQYSLRAIYEAVAHGVLARTLLRRDGVAAVDAAQAALDMAGALVERTGARMLVPSLAEWRAELALVLGDAVRRQELQDEATRGYAEMGARGRATDPVA